MDAKVRFIAECLRGEEPMTVLCERHGISRETGYLWKRRYAADGARGLEDRSRAPHHLAHSTPVAIVDQLIALREQHPYWGARKLLEVLQRRDRHTWWPAASTVTDILKRAGLVNSRRRRRRAEPLSQPFATVTAANDTWCIDFKGWFRTADGERCDPLTVTDAHSRYILGLRIMPERSQPVREAVDALFREYGLPLSMRSDNGSPFASIGAGGLSTLSVHWVKLGLRLERIVPGCPQQNGRHERMHATLKAETTRPAAGNLAAQQARFDRFRAEFNHQRPHEALGQQMPAEHYQRSPRPMPDRVAEPWYDAEHAVRRVRPTGEIKWGGETVFISQALAGEPVGIAETESGDWLVRFASVDLGVIDRRTKKLTRFAAPHPAVWRGTENVK